MCLRRRLNVIWDSGSMSRRTHGSGLCCAQHRPVCTESMPASSRSDALYLSVPAASSWQLAGAAAQAAGLPLSPKTPAAQAAAQPRLRHPPSWAAINHQQGSINSAHSQPMRNHGATRGLEKKKPRVTSGQEVAIAINGSSSAVCQTKKLEKPISPRKRRPASWLNQPNTKLV